MLEPEPLLHVEDDAVVSRALKRRLREAGYRLVSVGSCREARAVKDAYRMGVFDIDLPDGDSIALASTLRSSGIVREVVFYTATTNPDAVARALRVGTIVLKSDGVEALLSVLKQPRSRSDYPPPRSDVNPRSVDVDEAQDDALVASSDRQP